MRKSKIDILPNPMSIISENSGRSPNKSLINTWNSIDWASARSIVRRLQYRIYVASKKGNKPLVYWLQNKLITGKPAKILAVQRVTTLNKGRNTPGIDKKIVIKPEGKLRLAESLCIKGKASPIRRVWIDKPGKAKKRPLGIPTIEDRATQELVRLAIEPEWEALFEAGSYGFRPGRSTHDAIEKIFLALHHRVPKYVFDADIRKCFDRIDHDALLKKLNTFPLMEKQIRAWLKAGVMEGYANTPKVSEIIKTQEGTPQGGIISPLLANIALHGLENHLKIFVASIPGPPHPGANNTTDAKRKAVSVIRYADDFVVIHRNKTTLESCIEETKTWLSNVGLAISEEKSSLRDGREGFSFLGFTIIQTKRKSESYKVKIYPSRKNQASLLLKVRKVIQSHKAASSYQLIFMLRPIIIGWANYFRFCECSSTFSKLSHRISQMLRAWVFRRDRRSGRRSIKEKYFPTGRTYTFDNTDHQDNWTLIGKATDKRGIILHNFLPRMSWIKSRKHVMVKGTNSPYDPELSIYWSRRSLTHSPFPRRIVNLLNKQKGSCPLCKTKFDTFDSKSWEVDHIIPKSRGGKDKYSNLQLVHRACHIAKTSLQQSSNK